MPHSHHTHPEAAERTPAPVLPRLIKTTGKHWQSYPENWKASIIRIAEMQVKLQDERRNGLDWTDAQFTRDHDTIAKVWPALRTGSYAVPSSATTMTKWNAALAALEAAAKANLRRVSSDALTQRPLGHYIVRKDCEAIQSAIQRAQKRASSLNPDRVVAYVAETGCGKTAMIQHLREKGLIDWSIESAPSSYKSFMLALADMWGLPIEGKITIDDLKARILSHAKTLPGVFALDEIDTLDRRSLVLVKQLLNESTLVVCLFMTPETYHGLQHIAVRQDKQGSQLKQILRRFEALIPASPITPEEVAQFSPEIYTAATRDQLKLLAHEANAMGGIDAIKRIASNLTDLQHPARTPIPEDTFTRALRLYRLAVPTPTTNHRRAA